MRIISKDKDYYDSTQSFGFDEKVIYHRIENETYFDYPKNFKANFEFLNNYNCSAYLFPERENNQYTLIKFNTTILGFCGRIFLIFKFDEYKNSIKLKTTYFYKPENAKHHLDNLPIKVNRSKPKGNRRRKEIIFDKYDTAKSQIDKIKPDLWFHTFNCPVFAIELDDIYLVTNYSKRFQLKVKRNPLLKNIEFYRLKSNYNCYQEIQQYLSGVLVANDKMSSKMTDKEKIHSHGFDKKYGFRTRPKNK